VVAALGVLAKKSMVTVRRSVGRRRRSVVRVAQARKEGVVLRRSKAMAVDAMARSSGGVENAGGTKAV
jgi:hypothetical protein